MMSTLASVASSGSSAGEPQIASLLPNVFAGHCAVCYSRSHLSDCPRCGCVSYCGAEHRRQDAPFHQRPCQQWCRLVAEAKRKGSTDPKRDAALASLSIHDGELHQLVFHRCCCVCRSSKSTPSTATALPASKAGLIPCSECKAVFFCAAHVADAARQHACDALGLALECEMLLAAYGHRPPRYPIASADTSTPDGDGDGDSDGSRHGPRRLPDGGWDELAAAEGTLALSPAARALCSMQRSLPLTLLWTLQQTTLPLAAVPALAVHVLGPRLPEVVGLHAFEELLHRWPSLRALQLVLVGPELGPSEAADPEYTRVDLCHRCRHAGRALQVSCVTALYHEYAAHDPRFAAPHVALAPNAGLFLYPTWRPTLRTVLGLRDTLLVVTAHDRRDAGCDAAVCAELGAHTVLPPTRNPFCGPVPVRRPEQLGQVYQRSGWVLAVTGPRSRLWRT